jgi:hypothetical protein
MALVALVGSFAFDAQGQGRASNGRSGSGFSSGSGTGTGTPSEASTPPSSLPPPQDFFSTSPRDTGTPGNGSGNFNGSSAGDSAYSVRGLKTWYAQFDSGAGLEEISRCDPGAEDCGKPITESRYTLLLSGLIGWGPLRTDNVFFNLHYKYTQNWSTDYSQFERFMERWFKRFKAEDFVFTTKSMLRTHELASDVRYLFAPFQAGLFTRFSLGRIGSKALGEELEEGETVVKTENFVPYVSYKYDRYYRGQLSMPFRTEINDDDPRLSNASYSWKSRGRGRSFSLKLSNGAYVPAIDSLLYLDIYRSDFKYAAIQNDRTRTGVSVSFDFPIVWNIRTSPRTVYYQEKFLVDRVRIKGYKKSEAERLKKTEASEVPRKDTYLSFGLFSYWDFSRTQRLDFSLLRESSTSTISEFNSMRNVLLLGYSYSWPSTGLVVKRVDRFSESPYAEEF